MSKFNPETSIPPPWFVRCCGVVLLAFGVLLIVLSILNYEALGWYALVAFLSGATTSTFATLAIRTGNPEWILLDLIFPH